MYAGFTTVLLCMQTWAGVYLRQSRVETKLRSNKGNFSEGRSVIEWTVVGNDNLKVKICIAPSLFSARSYVNNGQYLLGDEAL